MKRLRVLAGALVVLASVAPARADGDARGSVLLPAGGPAPARQLYEATRANGLIGYVFRIDPAAGDVPYEMRVGGGATARTLDVYFYEAARDGRGIGAICPVSSLIVEDGARETGIVCPGPKDASWGIAVLVAGANATFRIDW